MRKISIRKTKLARLPGYSVEWPQPNNKYTYSVYVTFDRALEVVIKAIKDGEVRCPYGCCHMKLYWGE